MQSMLSEGRPLFYFTLVARQHYIKQFAAFIPAKALCSLLTGPIFTLYGNMMTDQNVVKNSGYIVNCSGTYLICCDHLRQIPNEQLNKETIKVLQTVKKEKQ